METATNQWEDTQLTAPFDGLPGEIFTPTEIFVSQNITTNNISFLLTAIIMNPGNRLFGAQQIKKEILKVKDVAKVELSGIQNRTIEVDVAPMNTQRKNGVDAYQAIIESTVSRVRPVLMAAITTILGMIPLLFDVVFPDFVIVSPKNLHQRVWRFSDVLPSALFGCKPPCSEVV